MTPMSPKPRKAPRADVRRVWARVIPRSAILGPRPAVEVIRREGADGLNIPVGRPAGRQMWAALALVLACTLLPVGSQAAPVADGQGGRPTGAISSSGADPNYPDLPKHKLAGFWQGDFTDTVAYVSRARQYVKVDDVRLALDIQVIPQQPGLGQSSRIAYPVRAYAIDGTHDNPRSFGIFPDIRVRTVAFGVVPVEATVQVRQLRDAAGLLEPFNSYGEFTRWNPGEGPRGDDFPSRTYTVVGEIVMTGRVQVRISDLRMDGRPVDVGSRCGPKDPAPLRLTGESWVTDDYDSNDYPSGYFVPPGKFNPSAGGELNGTLDIPAFVDCGGRDDLGPLLTAVVSGTGLPVRAIIGPYLAGCFNDVPAVSSLAACHRPDLPVPGRLG